MAARARFSILLAMAAVAASLAASANAQSGCTAALVGLYPCMDYISGNGTAPTDSCCSQLASVTKSQPQCLCAALGGDSSSVGGMTINKTRALELPKECKVQTPPASRCSGSGGGGSTAAPAGGSATPAGSGSKTTPAGYLQGNGGSSLHGPAALVLALATAALYAVTAV
ncbi:non-specific lipid-transfer protein-like protein At2g13820 [Brachypodium distachyon]|uniref:Bifunctional inhibitor/plant lipid transfer protein/seed storage helical domain-containing protein n=1 Tax=Brachypodium distachyon TaxID=15368 RepID=I1GMC2_BRADI|nr:non-specific lipid-transfer protein-like protein At2g13820 [Brachypodium distachyon]KQK12770.1 hypothetical protein BRADI_1g05850v3 [Brachypodium distachyon]|eukprot:XP_003557681.1 non-specific lipid-transfer protein-like protein At2g13820 [Brachypodium distachyon]